MDNKEEIISEKEAQFCLLYVHGPAPYAGDAMKCYREINSHVTKSEASYKAMLLLQKECVKNRIEELREIDLYDSKTLKTKITTTLLKIMDECAEGETVDRFGKKLSPAAMRAVSVNAAKTLNDMYGIKEDIAHEINLKGADGNGIVFNINVPQPNKDEEEFDS